jgi:hypothetical protein
MLNNISVSKTIYDESLWFILGEEAELFNHIVYESINVNNEVNKALDKILGYIGFNKKPQIIEETC